MICADLSDILYPRGSTKISLGENSCIVCALLLYTLAVTLLYANNVYIHYIDRHIRFVPPSWPQYTLRRKSQQRSDAGRTKVHAVCTSNLAFHRVVICAERNRIFSTIIIIGVIVVVIVIVIMSTVSSASCGRKIDRFKNSFMSRTSYEPSRIVISTSSLVK